MIYKHTADLVTYIDKNYGDRIDTLRMVTNGTIVPRDEMLQKLAKCRLEITVDDYREAVPQFADRFDQLTRKLDYSHWSEEQLEKHRESCSQSWQELRDGKLYSCNYAAYATVAGIAGEQDLEEVYDLTDFVVEKKKELVEFRLGYTTKGYTNFCKKCRGFTPKNSEKMEPAAQAGVQNSE